MKFACVVAFGIFAFCSAAIARETNSPLDALVAAYPDQLAGHEGNTLIFRDGTRMDAGSTVAGKPFDGLLTHATILDQFRIPYPAGAPATPPALNFDPGRFRNQAFFAKIYGDCKRGEVDRNLVPVVWLPQSAHQTLMVTRINGVADRLGAISAEIERLPPPIRAAAYPSAGVYSCRGVADNGQPSMHAFAAAIDLNLKYSAYWLWDAGKSGGAFPYRNRIPLEIVNIFERHGFIWGGRWYHFDTMHFEYRPELLGSPLPPATAPR